MLRISHFLDNRLIDGGKCVCCRSTKCIFHFKIIWRMTISFKQSQLYNPLPILTGQEVQWTPEPMNSRNVLPFRGIEKLQINTSEIFSESDSWAI
jgi:hypothetical protein